jgi:hypothetical protein
MIKSLGVWLGCIGGGDQARSFGRPVEVPEYIVGSQKSWCAQPVPGPTSPAALFKMLSPAGDNIEVENPYFIHCTLLSRFWHLGLAETLSAWSQQTRIATLFIK